MKRKKIALLISIAVLFFYCVSAALVFLLLFNVRAAYETEGDRKLTEAYAAQMSDYAMVSSRNSFEEKLSVDCGQGVNEAYSSPYIYAVFDASGRRVETRGVTLDWYEPNPDSPQYNSFSHFDISPWLTAETRAQLERLVARAPYHAVEVRAASFSDQRTGLVPTELTLYALFDTDETLTVPLSPFHTTVTVENDGPAMLHLDTFDLDAGRDAKRYARLREISDEFEAQIRSQGGFAKNATLAEQFGKKGYGIEFAEETPQENGAFPWLRRVLIEDHLAWNVLPVRLPTETQYLFVARLDNEAQDVLFSADFGVMAGLLALLFALAGAGLILFIDRTVKAREKQLAARRALTDAAAHELKTPLAVILNQTECLAENVAPEKQGAYIDSVRAEALRMNEIVTDLVRFNRLSDQKTTEKTACDLCAILRAEAEKYRAFAESAGVTLTLSLPESFTVNGNVDMLALAVDNYLSNAVKYAEGAKQVSVTLKTRGRHFRLEVYNDCVPLSAKARKSVWNVLSRGDQARARSGASTGLGLPTCAAVFRLHRFSYGCRAEAGGMVFWFRK